MYKEKLLETPAYPATPKPILTPSLTGMARSIPGNYESTDVDYYYAGFYLSKIEGFIIFKHISNYLLKHTYIMFL